MSVGENVAQKWPVAMVADTRRRRCRDGGVRQQRGRCRGGDGGGASGSGGGGDGDDNEDGAVTAVAATTAAAVVVIKARASSEVLGRDRFAALPAMTGRLRPCGAGGRGWGRGGASAREAAAVNSAS